MGIRVGTNVAAIGAQRRLSDVTRQDDDNYKRLSSGDRIHQAANDPAGLAISEKMRANIHSYGQAARNANDGISIIQVAEGALNEVSSIGVRLRELAMQAASDTIGQEDRQLIQKEFNVLKTQVDSIALSTEYAGRKVLSGAEYEFDVQVGLRNGKGQDRISVNTGGLNATTQGLGISSTVVMTKESAQAALGNIDGMIQNVSRMRSTIGSTQNRLQKAASNIGISNENLSAGKSRIRDADMAEETAKRAQLDIRTNAATSMLKQASTRGKNFIDLVF